MTYDIYGLGNALVDMEYRVDDGYLRDQGIPKGHMTLVDANRINELTAGLAELHPERMSGGSAANTIIAAQALGCSTFYSCKVAGDEVGDFFLEDLTRVGVTTNSHDERDPEHSGRCLVLVTPDAERSMNTFLGISSELSDSEIDEAAIRASRFYYVEGYLSSGDASRDAAVRCREIAEDADVKTALSLSDPSMVEFFADNLKLMLGNGVHYLFCNEEEAMSWAGTDRLDIAVNELVDIGHHVNVTLGARGCLVAEGHRRAEVGGFPATAIDTNGAGDIFAGACMYGYCHDMSTDVAARFGNYAASVLVSQYGARLKQPTDYQALLKHFS